MLVFPSDDREICTELGIQPLPKDYEAQAKLPPCATPSSHACTKKPQPAVSTLAEPVSTRATALSIARSVLVEHGFQDWTATVATGDYTGRMCANGLGFRDAEKNVLIIPSYRGIDPDPFGPH